MSAYALILSLVGLVLNARKNILCWPVWVVSDIMWLAVFIPQGNVEQIILWTVFGLFNFYGWREWANGSRLHGKTPGDVCSNCGSKSTSMYPVRRLLCGHFQCTYCSKDGCADKSCAI
jgi:hypothetical protein